MTAIFVLICSAYLKTKTCRGNFRSDSCGGFSMDSKSEKSTKMAKNGQFKTPVLCFKPSDFEQRF